MESNELDIIVRLAGEIQAVKGSSIRANAKEIEVRARKALATQETLVTALKLIIETAANAPGREACAKIATEALAAAEAM
jgi:hypothetical protein